MSRTGSSYLAISLSIVLLAGTVSLPAVAADEPQLNFKIYNPDSASLPEPQDEAPGAMQSAPPSSSPSYFAAPMSPALQLETPQLDSSKPKENTAVTQTGAVESTGSATASGASAESGSDSSPRKVLQGYVKVVPNGTKIPIIMDTAVDSDTSQEGDEFSARTSEDLSIDGSTVVPAGSIIKGRIAQLNSPRHLNRSGSVGLKFDTVTTPDNRSIPIVANLVARGGVVHAKRGLKDIAFDTGAVTLPAAAGVAIGALAGNSSSSSSSSSIGRGGGALIGAGVGVAVGLAILLSKKGKKVEVRPGDELKIELAEDLRMPEANM
jgi:hypothetical protein